VVVAVVSVLVVSVDVVVDAAGGAAVGPEP
jgi:hypothetical protein